MGRVVDMNNPREEICIPLARYSGVVGPKRRGILLNFLSSARLFLDSMNNVSVEGFFIEGGGRLRLFLRLMSSGQKAIV